MGRGTAPTPCQSSYFFMFLRLSLYTKISGYLREEPLSVLTKPRGGKKKKPRQRQIYSFKRTGSITDAMATPAACDIRAEGKEQRDL